MTLNSEYIEKVFHQCVFVGVASGLHVEPTSCDSSDTREVFLPE